MYGKHPTSFHDPEFASKIKMKKQQDEKSKPDNELGLNNAHTICDQAVRSMPIVPVKLRVNDKEITTYAMLDNCSTGTFILEDVCRELEAEGTETNVNTMNGSKVHQTTVVTGLVVMDLSGNNNVNLSRTFSRNVIPASRKEIPMNELVAKWKHLSKIADKLPACIPEAKIGTLIGSNCPKAIEPKDFIVSEGGGPFAMKTFAGWTVVGSQPGPHDSADLSCHRVVVEEVVPGKPFHRHFILESTSSTEQNVRNRIHRKVV